MNWALIPLGARPAEAGSSGDGLEPPGLEGELGLQAYLEASAELQRRRWLVLRPPDEPPSDAPWHETIGAVSIVFPAFTDGRGFSLAFRLRRVFGYRGHLRACGALIPDQRAFLVLMGFDDVAIDPAAAQRYGNWEVPSPRDRYQPVIQPGISSPLDSEFRSILHARHAGHTGHAGDTHDGTL